LPAEPKRLPGEPNPEAHPSAGSPDWVSGGRGSDYGIARGIFALLDWHKRRKETKARRKQPPPTGPC
jgi:hypothetical protein